ncbi:unnamed protein product [Pleuronectes platessa]|uniref:Uncharacterized protein n=1 Tax=Pleuronectes platessa TaxID=8262 RepID=A0A9N7UBJ2_PLEPL|nr:unnamed protein product [Pleuronectes platessa]
MGCESETFAARLQSKSSSTQHFSGKSVDVDTSDMEAVTLSEDGLAPGMNRIFHPEAVGYSTFLITLTRRGRAKGHLEVNVVLLRLNVRVLFFHLLSPFPLFGC